MDCVMRDFKLADQISVIQNQKVRPPSNWLQTNVNKVDGKQITLGEINLWQEKGSYKEEKAISYFILKYV